MRDWGSLILRGIIAFVSIFMTFAWLKHRPTLESVSSQIGQCRNGSTPFLAHACSMIAFGLLSVRVFGASSEVHSSLIAVCWWMLGIAAIFFGALAFVPLTAWLNLVRGTGLLWVYALTTALATCFLGDKSRWIWQPGSYVTRLTFSMSKALLGHFVSGIISNSHTMVLGTQNFRVQIAPSCSGLEGVALILAFELLWFWLLSSEYRFPQSLILIPLGVALIFLLNTVRLVALILIGNAGWHRIALGGFHSQAGWITFSAVAVGFCLAAQNIRWFTNRRPSSQAALVKDENPSAAYLLPFLMILAAGMIGGASSGGFDWLYPLRFLAAAAMLWIFRKRYADLSWKCDWVAPLIGVIAFGVCVGLDDLFSKTPGDSAAPAALLAPAPIFAVLWMVFRLLAAVITVPLAEELAFRGFLLRRLICQGFESVSFRRVSCFSLLASSAVFGLLHGDYWLSGSIAGILFGLAATRRARLGEAVVAHATANCFLTAYVLIYHKWHLW
jgi:exosortase E/protease (VPEID-CTERM system)